MGNPTTLSVIIYLCGGKTSCTVPVITSQLGDPCPHTPKYLEIVYTCQDKGNTHTTQGLPDWVKRINIVIATTTKTTKPAKVSTTTEKQATTSNSSTDFVPISILDNLIPDSQLLIQDLEQEGDGKEELVFVNTPV